VELLLWLVELLLWLVELLLWLVELLLWCCLLFGLQEDATDKTHLRFLTSSLSHRLSSELKFQTNPPTLDQSHALPLSVN